MNKKNIIYLEALKERHAQVMELANKTCTFKVSADSLAYVEEGLVHNLKAEEPELAEDLADIIGAKLYQELIQYASWLEDRVKYWTEQFEKEADDVEP